MVHFVTSIQRETLANEPYRRVLFTGRYMQLALMTLGPGDQIGTEIHDEHDQFIRIESGTGSAVLDGREHPLGPGSGVIIPAGVEHNVINTSRTEALRLYTLYGPPEHADGTLHRTKGDEPLEH